MDDFERASEIEQLFRTLRIEAERVVGKKLNAIGRCHYCFETVEAGATFCDKEHADDWQAEQDARIRNNGRL